MSEIHFFKDTTEIPEFNPEFFILWLHELENHEDCILGSINFILSNYEQMLDLNQKYLNHNTHTDVITFDYSSQKIISGDIFININFIQEYSSSHDIPFWTEFSRIIVHGTLHLIGYTDKTSDQKLEMTAKENFYLNLQPRST